MRPIDPAVLTGQLLDDSSLGMRADLGEMAEEFAGLTQDELMALTVDRMAAVIEAQDVSPHTQG